MTATTPGREVDAGTARTLKLAYKSLVKAGENSVRAAWRFGQALDSFSDAYTQIQLADAMNLSVSTLARYMRLYRSYQRPEEAVEASRVLETFNIDIVTGLKDHLAPVEHGRPLAGRHYSFVCHNCQSRDVHRVEVDEDGELVLAEATA